MYILTGYCNPSFLKKAVLFLNDQNVNFFSECENPSKYPQKMKIFGWSLIKEQVYKYGWKAENLSHQKTRITNCFKKS